jgi:hypothetical protein
MSEAALKSCHRQNTQSSVTANTVENDLAHTKVVVATVKQRNEDFVKEKRILVRQVNDLEKQAKDSREKSTQRARSNDKLTTTLQEYTTKAREGHPEAVIESLLTLRSEICSIMDCTLDRDAESSPAALTAKVAALQQERQAILHIISELRPGIVATAATDGLLRINMDKLRDEAKCIHKKTWDLRMVQMNTTAILMHK